MIPLLLVVVLVAVAVTKCHRVDNYFKYLEHLYMMWYVSHHTSGVCARYKHVYFI